MGVAALAAVPFLLVAVPSGASSVPANRFERLGLAAPLPAGARALGIVPGSKLIHLGIALSPRSPGALAEYAAEVSTPGAPGFGRKLTPAEFRERFGPTPSSVRAVEQSMRADGFELGELSANGLLLHVSAPVDAVEGALHLKLRSYALSSGGLGWAASAAPLLPRAISPEVTAVLGLNQLVSVKPLLARPTRPARPTSAGPGSATLSGPGSAPGPRVAPGAPRPCAAATVGARAYGGWTDDQIAKAYGLNGLYESGDLGRGETIAVFELEPYLTSDIRTFDECYFGQDRTSDITDVSVDGGAGRGSGEGEAVLDIDDISALAPEAHIIVYEGPQNDFGNIYASTDEYNAIVSQDRANIISTSWGLCESALDTYAPGTREVENYLFEEAAAQGQTVFAAAGDDGSDDCAFDTPAPLKPVLSVDDPASQPFVVGAGGTSLLTDTQPPSETVWNDGVGGGAGGGGISDTWASPTWQAYSGVKGVANSYAAKPSYDLCHAAAVAGVPPCREVPDVSFLADEFRGPSVYQASYGGWGTSGGTSSAAPSWAAIAADIAASSSCASLPLADTSHERDLGFVAPGLYEVAAEPSTDEASFNDITRGTNDLYGLGEGYPATKGFDLASGLGTPVVSGPTGQPGLATDLCRVLGGAGAPVAQVSVTGVSPSAGPAAGGTVVTITGNGIGSAGVAGVDFGGEPASHLSVVSPSELTATAPPAVQPPKTNGQASGPVDVTVTVRAGKAVATSRPSAASVFDYVATSGGQVVPSVRGLGPYGGPLSGGNRVAVYGSGFVTGGPVSSVSFGGRAAAGVKVLGNGELTAVVPPWTAATACETGAGFDPAGDCQVQVVVSGAHGPSPTTTIRPGYTGPAVPNGAGFIQPKPGTEVTPAPSEYDYVPRPTIRSITPDPADASGSTPVTITGSGFDILTFDWVDFGAPLDYVNQDSSLLSIGPDQIVLDPPSVSIKREPVRLAGGVSITSLGGIAASRPFAYAGVPSVTSISPRGGPDTGGEHLTLRGSGLGDATSLRFVGGGLTRAYDILARTDSSITVVAPADLPSVDLVEACSASGCSAPASASQRRADTFVVFNVGSPSVSGLSPTGGPAKGGTRVTVYGDNLDGATAVLFGAAKATHLTAGGGYPDGNPYAVTATAPAGTAGQTVEVVVVTGSGRTRPVRQSRFTYEPG